MCFAEAGIVSQSVSLIHMPHLCAVFDCSHNSKREMGKFKFFRFPSIFLHQGEETKKLSEERQRQWLIIVTFAAIISSEVIQL